MRSNRRACTRYIFRDDDGNRMLTMLLTWTTRKRYKLVVKTAGTPGSATHLYSDAKPNQASINLAISYGWQRGVDKNGEPKAEAVEI